MFTVPTEEEFLALPSEIIREIVYEKRLSISLLLNGTRRWYIAEHFDTPPTDNNYFPDYLQTVLVQFAQLIGMLAEHGLYRTFIPVYSWYQPSRNPYAHRFLLAGIKALTSHPDLVKIYQQHDYGLWFYGDTSHFPEDLQATLQETSASNDSPRHFIYYGVDGGNPYNYTLQLAHQFGLQNGHPPTWEDMLELYYGDRTLNRLNILIGFNRIYSRGGIPHLLEGGDRIYMTVVTPLVLNQSGLRRILYDYLYNRHDFGRDYQDIHPNEIQRLKQFYAANQDTIVGLVRKYEDLVYPVPAISWPSEMEKPMEPVLK